MKTLLIVALLSTLSFAAQAKLTVITMPLVGTSNVTSTFASATAVGDGIVVKTIEGLNECDITADLIAKSGKSSAEVISILETYSTNAENLHMSCYTENGIVTQIVINESK